MNEQERMEQLFRESQPTVRFQRPEPPPEQAPATAQKPAPLPTACTPLEKVVIANIHLTWNCVARLSLQFVLMSFLVTAFIAGIVWLIAGIGHGLATSLQTLPPPPAR